MAQKVQDNWYENFFSGINCEMWERAIPEDLSSGETEYLIDVMGVQKEAEILDVPSGFGRLAIPLAKKGFQVTCIDISEQFMDGLERKIEAEKLSIRTIRGNILTLDIRGPFDGAICMGNSFGYFDFAGMNGFVAKISACLKPGARFVINSGMIAESILTHLPPEKTYVLGDLTMQINNEYIVEDSCLVPRLTYTKNGNSEVHHFKHYVYTIAEIKRLLAAHGLEVVAMHNGFQKELYAVGDPQVFLVCEKKSSQLS